MSPNHWRELGDGENFIHNLSRTFQAEGIDENSENEIYTEENYIAVDINPWVEDAVENYEEDDWNDHSGSKPVTETHENDWTRIPAQSQEFLDRMAEELANERHDDRVECHMFGDGPSLLTQLVDTDEALLEEEDVR